MINVYYENAMWLTGFLGILAVVPCLFWYKKDIFRREYGGLLKQKGNLKIQEGILILFLGAAFALYFNLLIGMLSLPGYEGYQETITSITNGKTLFWQVFWMGVAAPFAEEVVFRWMCYLRMRDYMKYVPSLIISGLIFGISHGNLVQTVYAGILGIFFAFLLEKTGNLWSCVIAHMGANIFSLVHPEICMRLSESALTIYIIGILIFFLGVIPFGITYFVKYETEKRKSKK